VRDRFVLDENKRVPLSRSDQGAFTVKCVSDVKVECTVFWAGWR
jgi:hypothetical protein